MARFLVLIFALLFSGGSWSAVTYTYTTARAGFTGTGPTAAAAVADLASKYNAAALSAPSGCGTGVFWSMSVTSISESEFVWNGSAGSCLNAGLVTGIAKSQNSSCSGKSDLGGPGTSWSYSGDYPGYGGGYCIDGCSYDLHGYESYDKKSNMSAAKGTMKPTGGQCGDAKGPVTSDPSVNDSVPETKPDGNSPNPSACSGGGVPYKGTVNGKVVTGCGSPSKTSTTDTSQKDSSSTRTESGGTPTSGATSESKTTKTTCSDGKCTTTTTKSESSGGGASSPGGSESTGTETKTESQADYCKENPAQAICKEDGDSSFGGSCGAFNCDGDAIQCAIAREQHQRNCQLFEDRTPMTEIGEGAAGAGNRPSDHPGNNPDDIDVGARMAGVARENPFGDGCPRDFDLAVMGNVVTVPLSEACDVLKLMGEIAVAFAFIAGARIVMSGVTSGAT